jgi:hypothetical protein
MYCTVYDTKLTKGTLQILPVSTKIKNRIRVGTGHYLLREVAPKRKGLGKQNCEWVKGWVNKKKKTQGLGNKNLSSFPKYDSLKYWRLKNNVNRLTSIQHVNQSESLSLSFSVRRQVVSPKKVHVHPTWNFRLQKIAQADSCHRSGKGYVWQLNGILS